MATLQRHAIWDPISATLGNRRPEQSVPRSFVAAALDRLLLWQQRSTERRQLATLSEFHLKDIGLSRADADREAAKPFWRE